MYFHLLLYKKIKNSENCMKMFLYFFFSLFYKTDKAPPLCRWSNIRCVVLFTVSTYTLECRYWHCFLQNSILQLAAEYVGGENKMTGLFLDFQPTSVSKIKKPITFLYVLWQYFLELSVIQENVFRGVRNFCYFDGFHLKLS